MKRKYQWVIALPPEKLVNILYQSVSAGYLVWGKKRKIVIRYPREKHRGQCRINTQISFIAKLVPSGCNTILKGKFGVPILPYFFLFVHFLGSINFIFLSDFNLENLVGSYYAWYIIGLIQFIFYRIFLFLFMIVYEIENRSVINLLDSIHAEYGPHKNENTGEGAQGAAPCVDEHNEK